MVKKMRKILLVEDDQILRETYATILSTEPYIIDTAPNGLVALEKTKDTTYDLILLDLMMPVLDGVGFLEKFAPFPPQTKIIVLSNVSPGDLLDKAIRLGVHRTALKADLSPKQLLTLVRYEAGSS
jgi:CheY-like chemotaxis protein